LLYDDEGTFNAGIIAAVANRYGVRGMIPDSGICLIMYKIFPDGTNSPRQSYVIRALQRAADYLPHVVSIHFSAEVPYSVEYEALIKAAYDNGAVVVAPAGGKGTSAIEYPGGFNKYVLTVGSINSKRVRNSLSNFNSAVDLVSILRNFLPNWHVISNAYICHAQKGRTR
jgi:Subtilase family